MKYQRILKEKSAFTLVELSIVIVIIGLLVGATYSGIAILQHAETKALLSEVQKLNTSIGNFQGIYKGLPGDLPNATTYWSSTANGDGSGRINIETSNEPFRALQQLAAANLLEGSYASFTGIWDTGFTLNTASISGNVMAAKGRNNSAFYIKCCSITDYSRSLSFNNHINLFSIYSTITYRAGTITPVEALEIDKKIDDGVPDTGMVGGSGSHNGTNYVATGCYSGTGSTSLYLSADATYKNQPGCQMLFAYDWD